jgi:membrane-associated phospholipid phosphatase
MGAIGISAVVGLSRIYLRNHFWSDVAGGWGLGYGTFGLLAAVALVVAHIRQNGAADLAERPGSGAKR